MILNLANKLTICRVMFVPVFILTILRYSPGQEQIRYIALWIFLFAALSDALDGYVARKLHQETKLGSILDPLVDKVLLISAFYCIYKIGAYLPVFRFPVWLVVLVIGRDFILVCGAIIIRLLKGDLHINPTVWGKMTTLFEVLAVLGILLQWRFTAGFWYFILVLACISVIDYIGKGFIELNNKMNVQC